MAAKGALGIYSSGLPASQVTQFKWLALDASMLGAGHTGVLFLFSDTGDSRATATGHRIQRRFIQVLQSHFLDFEFCGLCLFHFGLLRL